MTSSDDTPLFAEPPRPAPPPPPPPVRRGFGGRSLEGLRYVYFPAGFGAHGALGLELPGAGAPGAPRFVRAELKAGEIERLAPDDRDLVLRLLDDRETRFRFESGSRFAGAAPAAAIPDPLPLPAARADDLLAAAAATGRLFLAPGAARDPGRAGREPLAFVGPPVFAAVVVVSEDATAGLWRARAELRRDGATIPGSTLDHVDEHGRFVGGGRIGRAGCGALVKTLRAAFSGDGATAPLAAPEPLLERLLAAPPEAVAPLPAPLAVAEIRSEPVPVFSVTDPGVPKGAKDPDRVLLHGEAWFEYDGVRAPFRGAAAPVFDAAARRRHHRDLAAEERRRAELAALPLEPVFGAGAYEFRRSELLRTALALGAAGWRVEARGVRYRGGGRLKLRVAASGTDWFDVRGGLEFDGVAVELPELLAAVREDRRTVTLVDGSVGIVPEDVLARLRRLRLFGDPAETGLRFAAGRAAILDELLEAAAAEGGDAALERDRVFTALKARLAAGAAATDAEPPASFRGALRPYQRAGLARLRFWDDLGVGGCLADDMGLGKTVQVLAFLAGRPRGKPSLVVAPRSLLFNWRAEAARFAPDLRVAEHAVSARAADAAAFAAATADADLVLTTYGLVRRDAPWLKDVAFDCVVLDEAQAVKNAGSDVAKATRLLRASRRLALSGTPVENRPAELWSLFEFLQPGLLGSERAFDEAFGKNGGPEGPRRLGRALRPFLLRRTKEEAAPDLPAKTEQVLPCVLEGAERRLYDELRDHYRGVLTGVLEAGDAGDAAGGRTAFDALAALLRLRQASCHPGLIDPARRDENSAKLDVLVGALRDVAAGGHRALVFSQFTSFLDLVAARLDAEGIGYERLDGGVRDREGRVRSFREDATKTAFLLSLKAGGTGLNLVEASYVFLLDPWWNPAAEAQATDRAHRIGQTRRVFVYRLVAQDTVEERVLALQEAKRGLAAAVMGEAAAPFTAADLRLLLR
jgi:superfamily II DNA or RNA helicase